MENNQIYQDALELWGKDAQIDMCIEEMAELTHALLSYRRGREGSIGKLLEELADVEIMIEQMKLIFNPLSSFEVEDFKEGKLNRLAKRVATSKANLLNGGA